MSYSGGKVLPLAAKPPDETARFLSNAYTMPTTNTNIALKGGNESGGKNLQGPLRTGSGQDFTKAFDGASLAGIRGFSDETDRVDGPRMAGIRGFSDDSDRVDGPRMAGIRGFSDDSDRVDGPRMAGIRGFSQPNVAPGGATFANTSEMLRLRESEAGESTLQFRNSGMRAYQDMLGMPSIAVG